MQRVFLIKYNIIRYQHKTKGFRNSFYWLDIYNSSYLIWLD